MTKIPFLKLFLFFEHPYLDKRYRYRQHRDMIQFRLMPVVSHLYMLGRTPQFISPASEKTFSSVTKNFLFERYD